MKTQLRYAVHPEDFRSFDTTRIRKEFLVEDIFINDEISLVYSMYDRFIVGGAVPVTRELKLESFLELKSVDFLDRRELGIINVGGTSEVITSEGKHVLEFKEALYLGKGTRDILFRSIDMKNPARLYINSAPAHMKYPSKKVTTKDAEVIELGSPSTSNHRILNKLLVNSVVETCQLQMGMTELKSGSVWNTMPVHTHARRMEAYFYFEVPEKQAVCHFMGDPDETRHLWMKNEQAVLSPSWSLHSAAGTSNYTFIWGMAGENLDYGDMDVRQPDTLK
ncbi:MAG: 5-dehydro-4-deoxy-D-glucuronate isomerase [Bacteroidales bacterium]